MSDARRAQEFIDLLAAAMADAADEGKLCQLQTTVTPPSGRAKLVRIIIVPEEMDLVRGNPDHKFTRPT